MGPFENAPFDRSSAAIGTLSRQTWPRLSLSTIGPFATLLIRRVVRKPLAKLRSEKTPAANVEIAKNLLSQ
jgi:hypothetical protein